ncbi:MAG: HlyU family transcriptional regulator [Hyphomicrobiaceae bacterium]
MSFWKKLFGQGQAAADNRTTVHRETEHKGFRIAAMPYAEAGQFQVAGVISKEIDGTLREHRFVRADRFATLNEATDFSVVKAQQIIDQQGEQLFG